MSLLGTQVYANSSTPCWVSASGDTIDGNLIVDGTLSVTGQSEMTNLDINSGSVYPTEGKLTLSASFLGTPSTGLQVYTPGGVDGVLATNGTLYVARKDANGGSTFITPGAAPNTDTMTVGGVLTTIGTIISPSVTPTAVNYGGTTNITVGGGPVTLSPLSPYALSVGREYDIQISGVWGVPAGVVTPATGDKASILVRTGVAISPNIWQYQTEDLQYPANPEDVWGSASFHPFAIRTRLACNAAVNLELIAEVSGTGVYPAGLVEIAILNCDVTVVK